MMIEVIIVVTFLEGSNWEWVLVGSLDLGSYSRNVIIV